MQIRQKAIYQAISGLAFVTLISGCDGAPLSKKQRIEVEDIAEGMAEAYASKGSTGLDGSSIPEKVSQLEQDTKRSLDSYRFVLDTLEAQEKEIKRLDSNAQRLTDHYNEHLRNFHGAN